MFYAFLVLHLLTRPRLVVKVDVFIWGIKSDFRLFSGLFHAEVAYAGHAEVKFPNAGWHQGGAVAILHRMGSNSIPGSYADGGFGYVLGQSGLEACFRMFMLCAF